MLEPLRILLVDDSPYDRGMVRRELQREFASVDIVEATNDSELNEALESPKFDLVITDYQIRWTDGLKVLRSFKNCLPDCPVLMFTATGNEEVAVEAMKSGLDDYIIKNVNQLVRLRTSARSALEHSRTRIRAQRLESRLAALLEHLRVGVFRRRPDGTIVEANDAAAEIFGLASGAELIGHNIADSIVDPILLTQTTQNVGKPSGDLEVAAVRKDERVIHLSISERAVSDEDGTPLIEGLLEDISERRNSEDQIRRLQDEIAHVNRLSSMAEMATGLAHELNQPLTAIMGFTEVCELKLRGAADPNSRELAEMLGKIKGIAHESGEIIRGLKNFAQRQPAQNESVAVSKLVDGALSMLAFELRNKHVRVAWDPPDGLPVVFADQVQIRQVLVNLITNAIDAMALADPKSRQLTIGIRREADFLAVTVSDRGPGIEEPLRDRLFDPFVSSKSNGTGIGLPISKRIIEAHAGMLTARNNEEGGATFEFTLPLKRNVTAQHETHA